MIGTTLSHYRVVEKIGEGGMGEVYRAYDERLDRDVAIKVLPEAVAQNPDRLARFEREAKAVAKLSHANILEIHDYGREADVTYAVTELLEGRSLREALIGGPLPWKKAIDVGAAVADGLAAAHEKSIVHRDIKPSNIFVCSDGRVKILDFGLASIEQAVDFEADTRTVEPQITREGRVMGTLGYMSPEQARGRPVDYRSDIFSLGCVLYELVSGRGPFDRASSADTMAAILKEEPPPLSDSSSEAGPEVSSTIERCLEKEPERRFQSASDLAYSLRAISSGSAPALSGPARRTTGRQRPIVRFAIVAAAVIAILAGVAAWAPWKKAPEQAPEIVPNRLAIAPFENLTGDPLLDTVGMMAADEIAHRFTETGAAEVVPIQVEPQGLPDDERTLQLARERGAAFLLSGAYYLDAENLRLQARLAESVDGDLIHAFEPVASSRAAAAGGIEALAERILAAVAMHLSFDFDISVIRPPSNYVAFQAFRRGFADFGKDSAETYRQCKRALESDPQFHAARYFAVMANYQRGEWGLAREGLTEIETHLDEMSPFEQTGYEYLKALLAGEGERSLLALRRMLELAPQISFYRSDLGLAAIHRNRPQEAVQALEPILLSWFDGMIHGSSWPIEFMNYGQHMLGEYQKELEYAELGLEHFPDVAGLYLSKAGALAALGETDKVNDVIDELLGVQTRDWPAGNVMAVNALELRAHGHTKAGDEMAVRSVEWFEAHPSDLESNPDGPHWFLYALWVIERDDQLEEFITQGEATGSLTLQQAALLGWIAVRRGDREKAMQISDNLIQDDNRHPSEVSYRRASIAAHLGEKERAIELLADAFANGYAYSQVPHVDPAFEPLWDYPPFQELLRPKG